VDSDYIYAGNELGKIYKMSKSNGAHQWPGGIQVFNPAYGASWIMLMH